MKNIVTFETAKKLEIAGFERPTPEIGQFWYTPNGHLYHISSTNNNDIVVGVIEGKDKKGEIWDNQYQNWFYAATATDILERLKTVYLAKDIGSIWRCLKIGTTTIVGYNWNAAEAVAEAYLSQSKQ
jgi:hypothetical protein